MNKQQLFFIAVIAFALINALVNNNLASLWEGPEALLAWRALHEAVGNTPQELITLLTVSPELDLLWMRFPAFVLLLVAGVAHWWIAGPIFGRGHTIGTFSLLAASLLFTNLPKVASGDVWALCSQWMAMLLMLRYLKQPSLLWQLLFYLLLFISLWIQPLNTIIFIMGLAVWLYFRHPQGKRLWKLNPWIAGLLAFGILYALQLTTFSQHSFVFGFNSLLFLGGNLLGILPFIGFILAGIWESVKRSRKGEELGNIHLGALLFALVAHSLTLQLILAMIGGKQLKSYFEQHYPFRNIVRAGAVLHLLFAAFTIIILLMGAYLQFEAPGFRAGLFTGGVYWMWSFIAIIGLYGMNERQVRLGTVFSGIFFILLFWLQVMPVLETKRSWAPELVDQAYDSPIVSPKDSIQCMILQPEGEAFTRLAPYAKAAFPRTVILDDLSQAQEALDNAETGQLFLLPLPAFEATKALPDSTRRVYGWNDQLQPVEYGWHIQR